jgi:A/G-specific adenine glycosylase
VNFAAKLICWQQLHGRHHLPWQNTRDPYPVWLSEIMLQQTQVATVVPYYLRFLQRYPDISDLALAPLDEVLALWSGLGYYARGRNLHQAAQLIVKNHNGEFPRDLTAIQQLPGIGRSTAAAIAVFAYGEHCAILDGNVKRVFARCFGIDGYPGDKNTETLLWHKAEQLLPERKTQGQIEAYTQALMDLGAIVCTRSRPGCATCPLQLDCVAFREKRVDKLPTARPRKPLPQKSTVLLLLLQHGEILLEKRPPTGIWGGLWCLPEMPLAENAAAYCVRQFGLEVRPLLELPPFDHSFTHFKLRIHPQPLQVIAHISVARQNGAIWLAFEDALAAAIPAPVRKLLLPMRNKNDNYIGRDCR